MRAKLPGHARPRLDRNVGLARLAEGTELVRVGKPLRPEFAAWRYGDQFGKRRRRRLMFTVGMGGFGAAAVGAAVLIGPVALLALPALGAAAAALDERALSRATFARGPGARALLDNEGEPVLRPREAITGTRIRAEPRDGAPWWLEVRTARWDENGGVTHKRKQSLVGSPAVRAASVALAAANASGGSQREVQAAVSRLERAGGPERYFSAAEGEARKVGRYQELWIMPQEIRLALEMAAHEDAERRAMEGELAELERQWRAAEEVAAIADTLAVPAEVERKLAGMKGRRGGPQ